MHGVESTFTFTVAFGGVSKYHSFFRPEYNAISFGGNSLNWLFVNCDVITLGSQFDECMMMNQHLLLLLGSQ